MILFALHGLSGSGKTRWISKFKGKVLYFDTDNKTHYLQKNFKRVGVPDWETLVKYTKVVDQKKVDLLVIDTLDMAWKSVEAYARKINNNKMQVWGEVLQEITGLIVDLNALKTPVVILAHSLDIKLPNGDSKYAIASKGQIKEIGGFMAFVDEVYHLERIPKDHEKDNLPIAKNLKEAVKEVKPDDYIIWFRETETAYAKSQAIQVPAVRNLDVNELVEALQGK